MTLKNHQYVSNISGKHGEEVESGGTRMSKSLQRDTELLGKEKLILKEKERRRENEVSDKEKYNFKKSGIGNSWLIGDDTTSNANAYVNYMSGCELNLKIPHELTDESEIKSMLK